MAIVTDRHVDIYQQYISQVREDIGRIATIYLEPTLTDCTWCILDPTSNRSSGVRESGKVWSDHPNYKDPYNTKVCPECDGVGYTSSDNIKTVKGTAKDLSYSDRDDTSGVGYFRPGTIRFSCDLDDVLQTVGDRESQTWFDLAIKVVFDGITYNVINTSKSGLRDLYSCRAILERTNK